MISDPGSVLYQELEQNQIISAREGYWFPERNRLLHFLFADARIAEKISVWKPIGEHLLKSLRPDDAPEYAAYLNGAAEGFDEARWKDSTFAGIVFFNLMVTAAAHQGLQWHMWVYYFPLIVERLVDIYDDSTPGLDTSDEFPTRGTRLIYEALDTLGNWVQIVRDLPEDSPHRKIKPGFQCDNGNIPVSAAVALGSCIATIVMSARIGREFAGSMHEVVMRDIRTLACDGVEGAMRSLLIQSVVRGGQAHPGPLYQERLGMFFERADLVLQAELEDYRAALVASGALLPR
jgi:hypothetical protein